MKNSTNIFIIALLLVLSQSNLLRSQDQGQSQYQPIWELDDENLILVGESLCTPHDIWYTVVDTTLSEDMYHVYTQSVGYINSYRTLDQCLDLISSNSFKSLNVATYYATYGGILDIEKYEHYVRSIYLHNTLYDANGTPIEYFFIHNIKMTNRAGGIVPMVD